MKPRIKIDSTLLIFIILLTGVLYFFPRLYIESRLVDNVLDFFGLIMILKGTLLRMAARGHKKANSERSENLVISGPYILVRNPMYLGSFMIGAGFVLIVWPWWSLPIFAWLFYMRFNQQVIKEEEMLMKIFGDKYKDYCKRTSRGFPSVSQALKVNAKEVFDLKEAFSTKEQGGLIGWPILAVILETFQEKIVFGSTNFCLTLTIFMAAMIIFAVGFAVYYQKD